MICLEHAVKLHRKGAFIALEALAVAADNRVAVLAADGHAVLFDILPFLMLALQFDRIIGMIIDANAELIARADAARFFPESGIKRIVKIEAADQILAAVESGMIVLLETRLDACAQEFVLPLGDDVLQFVPVLLSGEFTLSRHLSYLPVLSFFRRCSSSRNR
ncbi:hypothetical protein SDC9_96928 [bioreactor metagenome]|uniref:Uncharacterized protein n=1 Tax=bioreactor metagenome TaxID=1076179 RepID=A0A645AAI0_9ZZZZ